MSAKRMEARAKPSPPTCSSTPKSPSAGRQSTEHKLPQHCYDRHIRQPRAHAQTAAPTLAGNGKDTPERTEPAGQTHHDGTRQPPETERQATGNAQQKRPERRHRGRAQTNHQATGEAHRRAPGHEPNRPRGGHSARQDKGPEERPTHGLRGHQRTEDSHGNSSRKARSAPEQTTRRAQETLRNRCQRTRRSRRLAKPTTPAPTGTKNTTTAEKTQKQRQNRW